MPKPAKPKIKPISVSPDRLQPTLLMAVDTAANMYIDCLVYRPTQGETDAVHSLKVLLVLLTIANKCAVEET